MNTIRKLASQLFTMLALSFFATPTFAQWQFGWVMPLDSPAASVEKLIADLKKLKG